MAKQYLESGYSLPPNRHPGGGHELPMRLIITFAAALTALPASGQAQYYVRGWNTAVIAVPMRPSGLTTSALPALAAPNAPDLTQNGRHAMAGIASYYWQPQTTSSGERFDKGALTAAHRTLPMHTRVKVTHVASGRSVIVRINDRGPFKPGRVVDLSDRAAEILNFKDRGLAQVRLEVVR